MDTEYHIQIGHFVCWFQQSWSISYTNEEKWVWNKEENRIHQRHCLWSHDRHVIEYIISVLLLAVRSAISKCQLSKATFTSQQIAQGSIWCAWATLKNQSVRQPARNWRLVNIFFIAMILIRSIAASKLHIVNLDYIGLRVTIYTKNIVRMDYCYGMSISIFSWGFSFIIHLISIR
jgi:hypothetical protein